MIKQQQSVPTRGEMGVMSPVDRLTEFAPVDVGELIYALNLFVSAASRSDLCKDKRSSVDSASAQRASSLFERLAGRSRKMPPPAEGLCSPGAVTLEEAFASLWSFYQMHSSQESICARVLGFYLLMERTRGAALVDWMEMCPKQPRSVLLHPSIVEALAVIPIDASGVVSADLLISTAVSLSRPELAH